MRTKVYTCQHEGCTAEAEEWCIDGYDPVPTFVYCHEHAAGFGFCLWCGHFIGGTEDVFLTGQVGMCFECFIREQQEHDRDMFGDDDEHDDSDFDY
jgi:hypothetical protein